MDSTEQRQRFEVLILPHLAAAYNLARWLLRREHDAQDAVQDALLRAFRHFDQFHGGNERAWLMCIVRNVCHDWYRKNHQGDLKMSFDEPLHGHIPSPTQNDLADPFSQAAQVSDAKLINAALENLPLEYREVIILRDLDDFSYKEIAAIVNIPMGTVMSRLARGRQQMALQLKTHYPENSP